MSEVKKHAFGRNEAHTPAMLAGLDRLAERLVARIRQIIEPMVGVKPAVTRDHAEVLSYGDWIEKAPGLAGISVYRLNPLRGSMLVRLEAAMIADLVDAYYGGQGGPSASARRTEFTPTEERVLAKLTDGIVAQLVQVWADRIKLDMAPIAREVDAAFANIAHADDQVLRQRFTVSFSRARSWPLDILFPFDSLRAIESLFGTKVQEEGAPADPEWRKRLADRMNLVRMPLRSVIARPTLTVGQLMNLAPGDLIPFRMDPTVPLIAENRVIAKGTVGEQDGRVAIRIERMIAVED